MIVVSDNKVCTSFEICHTSAYYKYTSAHRVSLILMAHAKLIHRGLFIFNEVLTLLGT